MRRGPRAHYFWQSYLLGVVELPVLGVGLGDLVVEPDEPDVLPLPIEPDEPDEELPLELGLLVLPLELESDLLKCLSHSAREIWPSLLVSTDEKLGCELLLMPALNDMFDITTTRLAATQMHPPGVIYAMLIALALVAALLAGYQSAGEKGYAWIHKIAFATIVSLTVYVILDIEYPRLGLVRLDAIDQLLIDVRAGMK